MFALGLGVLYLGYSVTLYGYILIRGYDVSFKQMFVGEWPPTSGSTAPAATAPTVGGASTPTATSPGTSTGSVSA